MPDIQRKPTKHYKRQLKKFLRHCRRLQKVRRRDRPVKKLKARHRNYFAKLDQLLKAAPKLKGRRFRQPVAQPLLHQRHRTPLVNVFRRKDVNRQLLLHPVLPHNKQPVEKRTQKRHGKLYPLRRQPVPYLLNKQPKPKQRAIPKVQKRTNFTKSAGNRRQPRIQYPLRQSLPDYTYLRQTFATKYGRQTDGAKLRGGRRYKATPAHTSKG